MGLKQWRAAYEYKKGLVTGAGACFAIAETEAAARELIEKSMPGVHITQIREEHDDPLAIYERRPVLSIVRAENMPAAALEQPQPCPNCEGPMTPAEAKRGWCDACEHDREIDLADARGHS